MLYALCLPREIFTPWNACPVESAGYSTGASAYSTGAPVATISLGPHAPCFPTSHISNLQSTFCKLKSSSALCRLSSVFCLLPPTSSAALLQPPTLFPVSLYSMPCRYSLCVYINGLRTTDNGRSRSDESAIRNLKCAFPAFLACLAFLARLP